GAPRRPPAPGVERPEASGRGATGRAAQPDRDHRASDARAVRADDQPVIRNAVIHITNEQPLLADLYDVPTAADVSLVCTNVRMLDGKKPIFVDHSDSIFVFPYLNVRLLELVPV